MDSDLKELLSKSSGKLTDKDYRKIYGKLDEIKSNLGKLYHDRTEAKNDGDSQKVHQLTNIINNVKATKTDLEASAKNQYIVKLPTKKIIIKKSTLQRSKDPTKYVENKIREYEIKQIENELKEGNAKQAAYLMKLHKSFKYKTANKKQESRLKKLDIKIMKSAEEKPDDIFKDIEEFIQKPDKEYIPIITMSGNVIKVTKIG